MTATEYREMDRLERRVGRLLDAQLREARERAYEKDTEERMGRAFKTIPTSAAGLNPRWR